MASSSSSPCAACKFLRRKCTQGCVFAPYFPPDQPTKFANVHRVFGASNVAKLLNDIPPAQREDAVNSLAYEAEARLRDPVYGVVGYISILQHRLKQVQQDLYNAKKELSSYLGPSAVSMSPFLAGHHMNPHHQLQQHPAATAAHHGAASSIVPYGMPASSSAAAAGMGLGLPPSGPPSSVSIREQQYHQQQIMEAQQFAAAVREQEMLRSFEQQQHDFMKYSGGSFDVASSSGGGEGGAGGFNQMGGVVSVVGPPSGLALAPQPFDNLYQVQQQPHHHQEQQQQQQQQQQLHDHHGRVGSDGGRSSGSGPGLPS